MANWCPRLDVLAREMAALRAQIAGD